MGRGKCQKEAKEEGAKFAGHTPDLCYQILLVWYMLDAHKPLL